MFGFRNRRKLEEDLEKVRHANLSGEQRGLDGEARQKEKKEREATEGFGFKDYLAMTLAVFSIVLPYVLGIMLAVGVVVLLLNL